MVSRREARLALRQQLRKGGLESPDFESACLLEHVLGASCRLMTRQQLEEPLTGEQAAALHALTRRRLAGEPLQYLLGEWEFYGLPFRVGPGVLIPRQDTEALCEAALAFLRGKPSPRVLDLCAGSGAIGLSLAKLCPQAKVTLADVSADACAVMGKNRRRLGVEAEIVQGDLFAPTAGRRFDLIACNPPYIRAGELDSLQAEVQREPRLALDGGADGLDVYRRIAATYKDHLADGGALFLEIGWDEAEAVRALFGGGRVLRDLNGRDRVIEIRE